jgi:hypothetical protein
VHPSSMAEQEQFWIPLVDEPIGGIVEQVRKDDPELDKLIGSPDRLLTFRTFAYIRVGVLLGRLLVEHDLAPYDGTETWVERLLHDPEHRRRVAEEIRAVAQEVAADPRYAEGTIGPGDEERARFREFVRSRLGS